MAALETGLLLVPSKTRVGTWPTYLLTNVPESDRRALSEEAAAQDSSVADVVRAILCARLRLDCPRESLRYAPEQDTGATTLLLRLQPKLARALDREVARTGYSKRRIILESIEGHYEGSRE